MTGHIVILGGDGYLGWPSAMHFSRMGFDVTVVDNYLRRSLCRQHNLDFLYPVPGLPERAVLWKEVSGKDIRVAEADLAQPETMRALFTQQGYEELCQAPWPGLPLAVLHYAEQPSAPFSQLNYQCTDLTVVNNLRVTTNLLCAIRDLSPESHIVHIGTMGEYGTPNIDIEEGFYYIQNANEASTQLAKVGDYRYEDLAATNAMFTYWNQSTEVWDRGVAGESTAPTNQTSTTTSFGDVIKINTGLNADQHKNDRASKGNLVYSSEKLTIPSAQWYIKGNGDHYVMINRESGRQWNTEYWWATEDPEVFVNQATYTDAAGQLQTYRDTIRITPVPANELNNPYLGYLNLSQKEVQNDTTTFAIGMTSMGDVTFSLVEEDGVLKMKQDANGKYKLERVVTKDVDTYVSAGEHFTDDLIYGYVPMLSANEADTAKMLTRAKYYIYKDDVSANTGLDEDGKGVCLRDYIVLENGQYKTKTIEVKFETVKSDEGDVLYSINRTAGEDEYTKPNNVNARRAFYIKQITPNANEYVLVDPYVVATTGNNTGKPTYGARVFVNQQTTELQPGSLVSNGYANSYANSILTIAPESAQNYFDIRREGADLDTVKIFVANNPSRYS